MDSDKFTPKLDVTVLDKDWWQSHQDFCTIRPDNQKPVEVSRTITGTPKLIFEYADDERYSVDILSLFTIVDAIHKARIFDNGAATTGRTQGKKPNIAAKPKQLPAAQPKKVAKPKLNLKKKKSSTLQLKRKNK